MDTQDGARRRIRASTRDAGDPRWRVRARAARSILCLWLAAMGLCAAVQAQPAALQTPTMEELVSELSWRGERSPDELRRLIADCTARPQGDAFCAQRDAVSAELTLRRTAAEAVRRLPACRPTIEASIRRWGSLRDSTCTWRAAKEWGGGAMEPTARNLCLADSTARMTRRIERIHACRGPG
ncbi:lysozyme inhibitor LprI family protein [Variovorax sp. ZT4R33]|uniref:lysozyme inhibitor LprI family protein n=1 Tax=Variovorax sp. ZT4R33 TaxID=3443743 RepID=UPI003F46BC1A